MQSESSTMRVVAAFGRHWHLLDMAGAVQSAIVKGRKLRPVCGDQVRVETPASGQAVIVEILARRNELNRWDSRGRTETLVANIDVLLVVVAEPPKPDWFVVDRYLSAAELLSIDALVVCNKADLGNSTAQSAALGVYERVGYSVLRCSAHDPETLEPLAETLGARVGALVGLSGVGKSSIINQLSSRPQLAVGAVSPKTGEGRHTTVSAMMRVLPTGGALIDSPGVRDYAPALDGDDQAAIGFREIAATAERCRYANCRHFKEPNCAVKDAVDEGCIDPRRYRSYRRLLNLQRQLTERRR